MFAVTCVCVFPPQTSRTQQQWERWWRTSSTRIRRLNTVTHINAPSLFPCKYSVNKHWLSVSCAACLVVRWQTCRGSGFRSARPRPAVISDVHTASVIGIHKAETMKAWDTMQGEHYTVQPAVSLQQVCEFASEEEDQRRHYVAVSQRWQAAEKASLIINIIRDFFLFPFSSPLVSTVSSQRRKALATHTLHNAASGYIMTLAWQQDGGVCQPSDAVSAGRHDWRRWRGGDHPLLSMGGSYNHLCTPPLFFLMQYKWAARVFVCRRVNVDSGVLIGRSVSSLLCFCPLETCSWKPFPL